MNYKVEKGKYSGNIEMLSLDGRIRRRQETSSYNVLMNMSGRGNNKKVKDFIEYDLRRPIVATYTSEFDGVTTTTYYFPGNPNSLDRNKVARKFTNEEIDNLSGGGIYSDKELVEQLRNGGYEVEGKVNSSKRKKPITFKRGSTKSPVASSIHGPGKGWHGETVRHSNASIKGWRGRK